MYWLINCCIDWLIQVLICWTSYWSSLMLYIWVMMTGRVYCVWCPINCSKIIRSVHAHRCGLSCPALIDKVRCVWITTWNILCMFSIQKKKKILHRQPGPLRGSWFPLSPFELATVVRPTLLESRLLAASVESNQVSPHCMPKTRSIWPTSAVKIVGWKKLARITRLEQITTIAHKCL